MGFVSPNLLFSVVNSLSDAQVLSQFCAFETQVTTAPQAIDDLFVFYHLCNFGVVDRKIILRSTVSEVVTLRNVHFQILYSPLPRAVLALVLEFVNVVDLGIMILGLGLHLSSHSRVDLVVLIINIAASLLERSLSCSFDLLLISHELSCRLFTFGT